MKLKKYETTKYKHTKQSMESTVVKAAEEKIDDETKKDQLIPIWLGILISVIVGAVVIGFIIFMVFRNRQTPTTFDQFTNLGRDIVQTNVISEQRSPRKDEKQEQVPKTNEIFRNQILDALDLMSLMIRRIQNKQASDAHKQLMRFIESFNPNILGNYRLDEIRKQIIQYLNILSVFASNRKNGDVLPVGELLYISTVGDHIKFLKQYYENPKFYEPDSDEKFKNLITVIESIDIFLLKLRQHREFIKDTKTMDLIIFILQKTVYSKENPDDYFSTNASTIVTMLKSLNGSIGSKDMVAKIDSIRTFYSETYPVLFE